MLFRSDALDGDPLAYFKASKSAIAIMHSIRGSSVAVRELRRERNLDKHIEGSLHTNGDITQFYIDHRV